MTILRTLAISMLLLACDCGGANGRPAALSGYGEEYEVTQTDSWTLPGLTFYRVVETGVQDRSSSSIVAVDESGALIEGAALFLRFGALPPDALAERACATLIDGCTPLAAADPSAAMWLDGDASRVEAPHVADGHLVFDVVDGDMAPRVIRFTIDLANGNILARDALRELTTAPGPTLPTPALPATIAVTVGVASTGAPRFVTANLTTGAPSTISGCVSTVAGACVASVLVTLDDDAASELAHLYADVLAIPRCEPDGIFPGDLDYTLSWPDAPRAYSGKVPGDASQMAARGSGPCRADARMAWWIARWVLATSRPIGELPSQLLVIVDATDESGPRFVNANVDFAHAPLGISGCTTGARGMCRASTLVELDATHASRLRTLVEDLRTEPCHVPFPAGAPISLEVGRVYDGRCGADAALAWWVAGILDPTAMGAN